MNEQNLLELISELQNGNDRQRRAASYKLSKSKNPAAVPALIHAYNDLDSSVRQNVIEGLRAIGTPEALDFLISQKEKLTESVRISIDGGELIKTPDGRIIIGSDPTIMTWLGIFFWGALALGLIVLTINSFLGGLGVQLVIIVPTCLFIYLAFSTYQQSQRGRVIIEPASRMVKSLKREINFSNIETLVIHPTHLPLRGGVVRMTLLALVTNEDPMILASVSGDRFSTEQKSIQIMNHLVETNFNNEVKIQIDQVA